jgi:hypothetical protein
MVEPAHGPALALTLPPRSFTGRRVKVRRTLAERRHVAVPGPDQRLGDDHSLAVESERGPAMQAVAQRNGITDSMTEGGVIRPGQYAVNRQSIRW